MQWNRYRILLATPQGLDSSALAIATDRAGGLGILDGTGQNARDQAIRRLRDFKVQSYAIRVQPHEVCQDWLDQAGENLVMVVCSNPGTPEQLRNACTRVHATSRRALCEVTSVAEAEAALDAGSDGLIAVGQEAGGRVGADSAFILLQAILARTDRPVWIRGGIGPRVAAGCIAAGATGVVLEGAILLARESPLGEEAGIRPGDPCLRPAHVARPGPIARGSQAGRRDMGPGDRRGSGLGAGTGVACRSRCRAGRGPGRQVRVNRGHGTGDPARCGAWT